MSIFPQKSIKGNLVNLCQINESDASPLSELVSRNIHRLRSFLAWARRWEGPQDQLAFIKKALQMWQDRTAFHYILKFNSELIGAISIHSISWERNECQFGYWLDKSFTRKGLMEDAVMSLERELFNNTCMAKIYIKCRVDNHSSKSLALKLGYELDSETEDWITYRKDKQITRPSLLEA